MTSELIFVGLGLSGTDGMTVKALEALKTCDKIYAEFYTSFLIGTKPEDLEKAIGKKINVLYTQPGTTMRFEAPEGHWFGKMVFYCFHSPNFMVGDEYEELFEYEYNNTLFNQKLKVWTPASPKISQYDMNIWEGDERNILFCYPYFNAHFVKIDIRLVPIYFYGISEVTPPRERVNVYSLNGVALRRDRLRRDALNGLRPGLYIVDGKKVVVK